MAEKRAAIAPARLGRAAPEEIVAVAALAAATLREAWSPAAFGASSAAPGGMLLVARGGPDDPAPLLGFLAAQQVLEELHVLALATHPGARRRGIAKALLATALAAARAAGAQIALLEVRPSNRVACEFYAQHGFAVVGRRPRYYPDGEDALLLTHGTRAENAPCKSARATGARR